MYAVSMLHTVGLHDDLPTQLVVILSSNDYLGRHPCLGLKGEEAQIAYSMSLTWASHIATNVLTGW